RHDRNRSQYDRRLSPSSGLRGQDNQERESRGSSHRRGDEFSIGDQPEDRQSTRTCHSAIAAVARGRGDSVVPGSTMNRRRFLLLAAPLASLALAQPPSRTYRIGYLGSAPVDSVAAPVD